MWERGDMDMILWFVGYSAIYAIAFTIIRPVRLRGTEKRRKASYP